MNTYYETEYNSSRRVEIQGKMRGIREKLKHGGYNQTQSSWETWDGSKK